MKSVVLVIVNYTFVIHTDLQDVTTLALFTYVNRIHTVHLHIISMNTYLTTLGNPFLRHVASRTISFVSIAGVGGWKCCCSEDP